MIRIEYLSSSYLPKPPPRRDNGEDKVTNDEDIISEGEKAMFKQQDTLRHQYEKIMEMVDATSSSKTVSLICRAVITATTDQLLFQWRRFVINMETSILEKSSEFVGANRVVPMSKINSEFRPWVRRMTWMHKIIQCVITKSTSAAAIINLLEDETQTGYSDIQSMATVLLIAAQRAWMRSIAPWVLYGKLPPYYHDDFLIQKKSQPDSNLTYALRRDLVPRCLTEEGSNALLSTGNSLNQINTIQRPEKGPLSQDAKFLIDREKLSSRNLRLLESLVYPLNSSLLEACFVTINQTISQKVLAKVLSIDQVNTFIDLILEYILIGRGEFKQSLFTVSSQTLAEMQQTQKQSVRDQPLISSSGRLNKDIGIKQTHLTAILDKTWTELSSLSDVEDNTLMQARRLIHLTILPTDAGKKQSHISTFLPVHSTLTLVIPPTSPFNLLLTKTTKNLYASISMTLLSLSYSITQLSDLWNLTSLRRCHPCPLGPPRSSTPYGRKHLQTQRQHEEKRHGQLRKHWARVSTMLHTLNELNTYWHGEVVPRHLAQLRADVERIYVLNEAEGATEGGGSVGGGRSKGGSRPGTKQSHVSFQASSRPTTRHSQLDNDLESSTQSAPSLLTAHTEFVTSLFQSLFLSSSPPPSFSQSQPSNTTNTNNTKTPSSQPSTTQQPQPLTAINTLLTSTTHYTSLFVRLQGIHAGLDLQEDEGVLDAFTNFADDETKTLLEMERVGEKVEKERVELVWALAGVGGGEGGRKGGKGAGSENDGVLVGAGAGVNRNDERHGYNFGNNAVGHGYEEQSHFVTGRAAGGLPDINHLLVKLDLG